MLQSAIEQHFAFDVTRERRMRDVYVLADTGVRGRILRQYPDPEPGTGLGLALVPLSVFRRRSPYAPMFPLDSFTVHSLAFFVLVRWLEEILGGEVIDETRLSGIYGFDLKERVNTPDAFIRLLHDEAELVITRHRREKPTLVLWQRKPRLNALEPFGQVCLWADDRRLHQVEVAAGGEFWPWAPPLMAGIR